MLDRVHVLGRAEPRGNNMSHVDSEGVLDVASELLHEGSELGFLLNTGERDRYALPRLRAAA